MQEADDTHADTVRSRDAGASCERANHAACGRMPRTTPPGAGLPGAGLLAAGLLAAGLLAAGLLAVPASALADTELPERPAARSAAVHPCPASSVSVRAASRQDATDACEGARAALEFFASQDLAVDEPVSIEIVPSMPAGVSASAAGCFLEAQRRVLLLAYERFRAHRTWFGVPIDRRLYRSVAAHEVAHALASCRTDRQDVPIQAKEYVAYVAMFATMDEAQREAVLAAYPGQGFEDESKMAIVYLFDPERFAAEAWRHYRRPGNGPAFLRAVLAGEAIRE